MFDNEWKQYIIMNTEDAPASVQCEVEKILNKRGLIDLTTIPIDEEITFEEIMKEEF